MMQLFLVNFTYRIAGHRQAGQENPYFFMRGEIKSPVVATGCGSLFYICEIQKLPSLIFY
jgi:hypothetical protein